nr:dematin isoform X3 [Gorilla gorilla gorilla]XP_055204177.1 dematin isoform X3 [Gorilla gorilla gorilla]XP_055204178.1 dematin isoform X3 [Gorilla gorilla gorilla]XP_055204179.1 dematin isoform X3 [Gorilla gorilla gorilla]XP_055204180.1 dematin isoform X3 [Gorilla gorilla gorilla]XP_055204181.1 dematin isoform X3 [Gorilla gorilla gorilla]XP_055204182.1 dematin isoform X3 [Gorilla gorilla gorilla]XP_055204183.1 dematin isoform X3 [Gorilla gorilla gorilla]
MERLQKAKMDNQVLGYKDLAAIPKDKAILDIERPDLMIYEPHFTYSLLEHVELPRSRERSLSPKSTSPPPSPEVWADSRSPGIISQASAPRTTGTPRTSLPHFHHPETSRPDSNIYKKPPIYKQRESVGGSPQTKHLIEDLIIESSKFPAAQPPDPNQPAKIETDYWPCPPSLAVVETEWRKRKASRRGAEEEEEEEDDDSGEEMKALRERQREELSKVTSNLGKMILKEEMEKSLPIRRKTRSLPDRTPFHTSLHQGTSKSSSLPAYGRTTLSRLQSTEFSPSGSETGSPGLQVSASWRGTGGAAEAGSWHLKVSGKGGCGATELPGEEEEAGVRLGRSPCPALAHCGFGLPRTERARGGGWTGGTPCPVCWSRRSIPMKC